MTTTPAAPPPHAPGTAGPRRRALVPLTIEGTTHHLRYDLNALALVEERLQLAGLGQIQEALGQISVRTLRTLLWAGLLHAQPALEETEVGSWQIDLASAARAVADAMGLALGTSAPAPAASTADSGGSEGNARRPKR